MRKRIAVLLGLVTLLVMLAGAIGSAAWFSDSAVSGVETATAGKLDIMLTGTPGAAPFTVGNMEPGAWSAPYEVSVWNDTSTMDIKYRFYDTFVDQSVGGFYDLLNVKVYHWFAPGPPTPAWTVIYNGPLKDLYIESNGSPALNPYPILPAAGGPFTSVFYFSFQLDSSAGNAYQLAQTHFKLTFDGTQVAAPWWPI